MNDVSSISGLPTVTPVSRAKQLAEQARAEVAHQSPQDAVEISDVGTFLAKLGELPDMRLDMIAKVRAEIEAGTYETAERLDVTVTRLLEELG